MCDEGKAKTDFARAVIERAMINGITPAQAAKELMEQRGEARMMSAKKEEHWKPSPLLRMSNIIKPSSPVLRE